MPLTAPPETEAFYFCDESSFIGEEYMAVGGLALPKKNLKGAVDRIKKIERPNRDEVKWTSTKHWNLEIRKAYVDCLADLIDKRLVHLHIRFAPFAEYEHSGRRKVFDSVSKAYYQLLLHRALRHYGQDFGLLVRPDDGECTSELERFVPALNADGLIKYKAAPNCIRSLICLDSKNEPMLQLLDVTLGALTAFRNERHIRFETSAAKAELANYAHDRFGIKDLKKNSDDGRRFSIWNVIPMMRRGPRG
jgi:hypothetical protein